MEIKYLTKLKETPKIGSWENRGVSEAKIEELENQLKIKLPLAFKEYLFLAGEFNDLFDTWNIGFDNLDWIQDQFQESLQNINLILKPYFAFAEYGRDQFLFFFLDEGDNPPVYQYAEDKFLKNKKEEYVYWKKTDKSFSDCIDGLIEQALKQ